MNTTIVYDKRTNQFCEIPLTKEETDRKKRVRNLIRFLEQQERERYKREHRNGYCPICGMLIPMNGECDCGYKVNNK